MYIKETNYRQHEKYGTDLHMEMWRKNNLEWQNENGDGPTCWNVAGESWRPEQGIIYDCYVKYVTGRSLGLVSWDGGVLEYIMLLPYNVWSV